MISASSDKLTARANHWVISLDELGIHARIQRGESTIGGGSLPGETLSTSLCAIDQAQFPLPLDVLATRLRQHTTPIITRVSRGSLLLDPRTVLEEQDAEVIKGFISAINH